MSVERFKLRLYDEVHHDMESVWAEEIEPRKAKLLNTPIMFPALAAGSVVDWIMDPLHGMPVSHRSDGIQGEMRQKYIDAVWNDKDIPTQ